MSLFDTLSEWGDSAKETVTNWSWLEDSDEAPKTTTEQKAGEALAEGSVLTQVDSASTNTGASTTSASLYTSSNTTLLYTGGAVLLVVLLVIILLLGRK